MLLLSILVKKINLAITPSFFFFPPGMISRVVNGNFTVSAKTNPSEELLVKMPQKSVVGESI